MSTLRVSNIEAKADASSPTIDEKVKVTSSQGRVLVQIDGKTAGITSIGINTTSTSFTIDANQNVQFVGVITAANVNTTGVSTFTNLVVSAGSTSAPSISPTGDSNTGIFFPSADTVAIGEGGSEVLRVNSSGYVGVGTDNPDKKLVVKGTGGNFVSEFSNTNNASSNNGVYISVQNTASATHALNVSSGGNSSLIVQGDGNLKLPTAGTKVLNSSGNPILQQTGSVLQVSWKNLGSGSFTATSTSSTHRATGFTNTITPTATTSKILHIVTIGVQFVCDGCLAIARGGTVVSPCLTDSYRDGITASYTIDMPAYTVTWLDSPSTTSSISYELYCRATGCGGLMFVGSSGDFDSSWTLMEIAG